MMMLNRGWGPRSWLPGAVACVVSLVSTVAQAGIEGSDRMVAAGIEGSDLASSVKVSAKGIEGSDRMVAAGIEGSDLASSVKVSAKGIEGSDRMVAAGIEGSDRSLAVLGVVEAGTSSTVTVLGQTVRLTASTKLTSPSSSSLTKGSLVAVYGTINADGTISASQINGLAQQYVAGSTPLYVRGVVKSANASVATVKVGNLSIDYSSSLYSGSSTLAAGSVAEFSGLQSSTSTLYASKAGVKAAGIEGSDLRQ